MCKMEEMEDDYSLFFTRQPENEYFSPLRKRANVKDKSR